MKFILKDDVLEMAYEYFGDKNSVIDVEDVESMKEYDIDLEEYNRLKKFSMPRRPSEGMYCPNCGREVVVYPEFEDVYYKPEYYEFCPDCGQAIERPI